MTRSGRSVLLALAGSLALAGCTLGTDPEPAVAFTPTLVWGQCPSDVEVTFLARHECGTLTVLADRMDPEGPRVELMVARAWPETGEPGPGLHLTYGTEVGTTDPVGGGITTNATLLNRVAVKIEWRGVGPHTDPVLRCPEVEGLRPQLTAAPTGHEATRLAFVDAVRRCGERLRAAGIDPADYHAAAAVEDAEELRILLGVDRWAVNSSYGTQSRYLFEAMRRYPGTLGPSYLDSPWPPHLDDLTGGVLGLRAGLATLFEECAAAPRCRTARPLEESWRAALARLGGRPLRGRTTRPDGVRTDVLVDAGRLVRVARSALGGDGPQLLTQLPAMIRAAELGRLHPQLAQAVALDPGLCAGYRPLCAGQEDFAWGVHLTSLCRDQLPFLDRDRLTRAIAGDQVLEAVYGADVWDEVCAAWDVPPADRPPAGWPEPPPVPLLLMPGRFDSFSDVDWAREVADASTGDVQLLVGHGDTHNTLGLSTCIRSTRDRWVADPTRRVAPDTCSRDHIHW